MPAFDSDTVTPDDMNTVIVEGLRFSIVKDIYARLVCDEYHRACYEAKKSHRPDWLPDDYEGEDDEVNVPVRMGLQAKIAIDASDILLAAMGLISPEDIGKRTGSGE